VGFWSREQALGQAKIDEHWTTFVVATNIAGADVTVDEAAAVEVGQGVCQVFCGSGEAAKAILATGGGEMRRQI
jgi:hypothetical protein